MDKQEMREVIISYSYGLIATREHLTVMSLDGFPPVPEHWRAQAEREAAPLLERLGL